MSSIKRKIFKTRKSKTCDRFCEAHLVTRLNVFLVSELHFKFKLTTFIGLAVGKGTEGINLCSVIKGITSYASFYERRDGVLLSLRKCEMNWGLEFGFPFEIFSFVIYYM